MFQDDARDDITKTVLLLRMVTLLCPHYNDDITYNHSGCDTDCRVNHGAPGGRCVMTLPIYPIDLGTTPTLHCECNAKV